MEPEGIFARNGGKLRRGSDRSCADGAGRPDHQKGMVIIRKIVLDRCTERRRVDTLLAIDRQPANSVRTETKQISRLLKPRAGFR